VWNSLVSGTGARTASLGWHADARGLLCQGTAQLDLHHIAMQKLRVGYGVRAKFLDQPGSAFLKAARGRWGGKE